MKDWFPHDYYATRDLAVVRLVMKHGSSAYGCFWLTIELMHSNIAVTQGVLIDVLCHTFNDLTSETAEAIVNAMLDVGLLKLDRSILNEDGDITIYSDRVLRNKQEREAIADTKRNAAAKRWKNEDKRPTTTHDVARDPRILNGGSPVPIFDGNVIVLSNADREALQSTSNASAMPLQDNTEQDNTLQDINSIPAVESEVVISFSCIGGKMFHVKQTDVDEMTSLYTNVDIVGELRKMYVWITVNPTKRKTTRGMPRFIHNWLGKAQDHGARTVNTSAIAVRASKLGERKSEYSTEEYDAQIKQISERAIERGNDQERTSFIALREAGTTD